MRIQQDNLIAKVIASLLISSLILSTGYAKSLEKTKTDLSSSANPAMYGQSVTFTATVTSSAGKPTGTVTFKHGNVVLAVASLNASGRATFTTNRVPAAVAADYSGDANFKASSSSTFQETVIPAFLTVSGLAVADKIYDSTTGAALDTGKAGLAGVVAGDQVTLNFGSATASFLTRNAGQNKIVVVLGATLGGTDAGHYLLIPPVPKGNILPAPLTVTADNQTRAVGTANPTLTASYSGFAGGETLATSGVGGSPSLNTSATTTSAAGSYPIVAGAGSLTAANYAFVFVNGTLTVTGSANSPASSGCRAALQRQADGGVQLTLTASPYQTCVVEASTDLAHWTAIATNSADANGQAVFVDANAKNLPARFYRGAITAP